MNTSTELKKRIVKKDDKGDKGDKGEKKVIPNKNDIKNEKERKEKEEKEMRERREKREREEKERQDKEKKEKENREEEDRNQDEDKENKERNKEYKENKERDKDDNRDKRKEELKKYTIERLIEFISKDNKPINLYSEDGLYKFIEVLSEDLGEKILIYIPSKYPIFNSPKYPSLQLSVVSEEQYEYHPSSNQLREYTEIKLGDETIEEQLLDKDEADRLVDYRDIDLDNEHKKYIKNLIRQSHSQLERLSLCTQKIKYKLGILSEDVLSVINRHNDINHFMISDELKFRVKNGGGDNISGIRGKELCIVVDLESYYNKLTTFNNDIRKIYVHLFTILNRVHTKELNELNTKLNLFIPIVENARNKYKKHQEYLDILNQTTNKINIANKKILELEELIPKIKYSNDNEVSKSFKTEKTSKELETIKIIRDKSIKLYIDIKNTYNIGLLNYDSALMNSLLSLDNLINNFSFLGLINDKLSSLNKGNNAVLSKKK